MEAKIIIERLSNRRLCRDCGRDYNLGSSPPSEENRCDRCGGLLYQREDDKAETISNRLKVYSTETAPVKAYYEGMGLLHEIDGNRSVEEISRDITSYLNCTGG